MKDIDEENIFYKGTSKEDSFKDPNRDTSDFFNMSKEGEI